MRPLSPCVRGSGSLAPALFVSGVGRPAGGEGRRRAADAGRRLRAGSNLTTAAAGPARLDSDAHDTANAADAGCPSALGGRDARGGASLARLPLPRLEDMWDACGVERAYGVAQGRRRSRSSAVAARARDGLAAAASGRRTPRDRSRPGCSPMTRPARVAGRVVERDRGRSNAQADRVWIDSPTRTKPSTNSKTDITAVLFC